jgi:hypothetical protein
MKIRNTWFDLTTFLGFLVMLNWSTIKIVNNFRDKRENSTEFTFTIAVFLLIALLFLWMSLFLGSYQERARHYTRTIAKE